MALTPRLELRQGQSLVMTPQLQQAIKLLQFSSVELREYVENKLSENPMLERAEDETGGDDRLAEEHGAEESREDEPEAGGLSTTDDLEENAPLTGLEHMNAEGVSQESVNALDMEEYDNIWERDSAPVSEARGTPDPITDWGAGGALGFESPDVGLENILSSGVSLRDHLLNQIQIELSNPTDRMIAVYLTDQLDECGRLPDELRVHHRLGCKVNRVADVLHRLQQFDPPGIFARSLQEGWAIQLREKDRLDPAMATLLDNIELLKQHDYQSLAQICHVDLDDVRDMINEIWALAHNPAELFDEIIVEPAIPDVSMRRGSEEKWIVELNSETLPKVLVNQAYFSEVSQTVRTKKKNNMSPINSRLLIG